MPNGQKGSNMFKPLFPITSNFDDIFSDFVDTAYKVDTSYPPYSIYEIDDNAFIEIALAGFQESDLDVYQDDDGYLVIKGERADNPERKYQHKGISYRKFTKKFKIDKNYEPGTAVFENGLLTIRLNRTEPKRKEIPIMSESDKSDKTESLDAA